MLELCLVRHAKSEWGTEFLKDVDRPLNERGYGDAYSMSRWYRTQKELPALILSSPATRALSTAFIFMRTFDYDLQNFRIEEGIYDSSVPGLLSIIKRQPSLIKSIMVFGHNPAITDVFNRLADEVYVDNVPTCGLVSLVFDTEDWSEIEGNKAKVAFVQFPKDFRNENGRSS